MSEVVFPCPEKNWEDLEEDSSGSRFCDLCLKKVYAKRQNRAVYCGVDRSTGMSYQTFLARFAVILLFVFGGGLFTNIQALESETPHAIFSTQENKGTIRGTLTDAETGEPLPFAQVVLIKNGVQITGAHADIDGQFNILAEPGDYEVELSCIGYDTVRKNNISIQTDETTWLDIEMNQEGDRISIGIIIEPPQELENHRSKTFRRNEIRRHPKRQ